jgi:hypothetical protein
MGLQDRDYVKKRRESDDSIEEYERLAREEEYGKPDKPNGLAKVLAIILIMLLLILFTGTC